MSMPKKGIKKNQSWRNGKKKYYISRNKKSWTSSKKKHTSYSSNKKLITLELKKKLILLALSLGALGLLAVAIFVGWISMGLPKVEDIGNRIVPESTKIFDRTGEKLLYEIHGSEQRTKVSLDEIPDYIKWATIAMEDKNFYEHRGISLWGIFRGVVWQTIRGRRAQGGSTLTQQFVKNAILTSDRKVTRKIKEWLLSYKIEKKYSKDEILQMYFNEIPYGSTAYGVEAASQKYFGKSARDINLAEAAILAALPQAPSTYSPYGPNRDLLISRQQYIIDLMVEQKYITEDEAENAKNYELEFNPPATNIKAPHFVMMIKQQLAEKYGEKNIELGGYKIITTLDLYKQEIAEEVIKEKSETNTKRWGSTNASLVSIDPKNGQLLALVGSRDYFDEEIDGQVNVATSKRQPGSSMKPLVYAALFLKGYTPNTILYDVMTNFSNDEAEPYEPHNYDDKEHGPVTIRKALAGSLNIPAVKAIYLAGINNVLDLAHEFGYTTLEDRDRFGLSLVLGGGEVKLLEHVNAYSAFAREGVLNEITTILKVEDAEGNVLEEYKEKPGKKIIDPKIARIINDILSDNDARSYAFGANNWLTLGSRPVAAKTGTTNDYRDAWTIGYTPSIVTGVWVGNNDNTEMKRGAAGGAVAAPIWHDYMDKILGDTPIEYFKEPEILETGKDVLDGKAGAETIVKIDKATGLLATDYTPESFIEEKVYSKPHCILYFVDKDKPLDEPPENPAKDPQFNLWEKRVLEWSKEQLASSSAELITDESPPVEFDNIHIPENLPVLRLVTPGNNQTISNSILTVLIQTTAPRGIDRVEYYINDNLLHISRTYPFNLEKNIDFLSNGYYNLKIRSCDDVDNCTTQEREFNLVQSTQPNQSNVNIEFTEPNSGLAISNIDFPLKFKIHNSDYSQIAQIIIKISKENGEQISSAKIQPVDSDLSIYSWTNIPKSGSYYIAAEAKTWGNATINAKNSITLIVNNIEPDISNNSID